MNLNFDEWVSEDVYLSFDRRFCVSQIWRGGQLVRVVVGPVPKGSSVIALQRMHPSPACAGAQSVRSTWKGSGPRRA
jgi:hypothetical protein